MKNIFAFLIVLFSLQACEDAFTSILEIDLAEHESQLAVSAHFTPLDTTLRVFVSNSLGILDSNEFDVITDAKVRLLKDGAEIGNFIYVAESGSYETPNTDIVNSEIARYELVVDSPKYGSATAVQEMPSPPVFKKIIFEADAGFDGFGGRTNVLNFTLEDDASESNYYTIYAYRIPGPELAGENKRRQNLYIFSSDLIVTDVRDSRLIFTDASFNGKELQLRVNTYNSLQNEEYSFLAILENSTLDRYHYLNSINKSLSATNNPFVEPVIVHQNIENGHGIFTLGNAVAKEIKE